MRGQFGIAGVFVGEAVAFLVHHDAAVVRNALFKRFAVVYSVKRMALVGAHVLEVRAQLLSPEDAFAGSSWRHHFESINGLGAVLRQHVGVVGEPARC